MLDFSYINEEERKWYLKDFSKIRSLLKLIRMALLTGEELLEDDFSEYFDFEPNNTLIYLSLFQAGHKMIRYGSKRATFIKTVNRDVEMLRKNKNFTAFNVKDDESCRIMIEVMQDRIQILPEALNTHMFDDTRFESGITGLELRKDGISYYYMPTDAITYSHLGLKSAVNHLARKTPVGKLTNKISERLRIIATEYEHYVFKSKAIVSYKDEAIPLYRGNIRYTDFDFDVMYNQVLKSADWLIDNMKDDGRFLYYYDCCEDNYKDHEHPDRKEDNLYYNDLRHSGGTIALLRAYQLTGDNKYLFNAMLSIDWSISILKEHDTEYGKAYYAYYNKKAKLGGAGIMAVALLDYYIITGDDKYNSYIEGLIRHLISRISESGEMYGYYIHPEYHDGEPLVYLSDEERKNTFSFYYPGEALLALGLYANNFDGALSDLVKKLSMKALNWIVDERPKIYADQFTALPSDAWLMQAIEEWTKNPDFIKKNLIDFVYNDADVMVEKMYKHDDSPFIDYEGGYYYEYGDHFYPDGARSEGLVAAYYMANRLGNEEKQMKYLEACKKAAMCQFHLFNNDEYTYAHLNPAKSRNAIRFKATRQWVRVDSIQHVACFFSRLYMTKDL